MSFIGWMLDVARDQSPSPARLHQLCERSLAAGYNAFGLYFEHRYAYPSAPFAAGPGALTPACVRELVKTFTPRGLRVIPFLNTLGHMEGFIRSEGGQHLAESDNIWSLQLCPSRRECVEFARGLIADVLPVFDDEWVHIGGDETWELGNCPRCAARAAEIGKHGLYAEHYGELCRWVLKQGRRPALWGDMLLQHPEAIAGIPRETIIFDWQYFNRPRDSTGKFRAAGFDVVCCPSIESYNSGWCFLGATQRICDEHAEDARAAGALGVLMTTWEFMFFSPFAAIEPLVFAAGRRLSRGEPWTDAIRTEAGEAFVRAAAILGEQIPAASAAIAPGTWRLLRDRFVIRQNPFELWKAWRADACGAPGDQILALCDQLDGIIARADSPAVRELRLPVQFHRVAVSWVRVAEKAAGHYRRREFGACVDALERSADLIASLRPELKRVAAEGGSASDPARVDRLIEKVHTAAARVCTVPTSTTWLPSFETLTHDYYMPGDQAAWRTGDKQTPLV
ncbi:MAG: family 20 glycosylhydrolase [Planctomycetes bacterium]|nr:family 20 glycosylhydrolase [Planctomycetota bacterium]